MEQQIEKPEDIDFIAVAREIAKQRWSGSDQKTAERLARTADTPLIRSHLVETLLIRAADADTPGQKLILAIINQAVSDLATGDEGEKKSAVRFFMGRRFPELCAYLSLDPEYAIEQLLRAKLIKRKPSLWGNF